MQYGPPYEQNPINWGVTEDEKILEGSRDIRNPNNFCWILPLEKGFPPKQPTPRGFPLLVLGAQVRLSVWIPAPLLSLSSVG